MADKKSRLAEIYKSEKATGGGLTSTLGKRFKEKFDPRQMFNQQGFMAALLPSIFKAYKAPSPSSKLSPALSPTASSEVAGLSNKKLDILIAQSKDIKINSIIVAKNSMSNAAMARDMNLMRQNIFQLVKLNKGKPTNKADMFFKHAGDRDREYKSKFKKESKVANNTAPTKTGDTGKSEGLLGLGGALSSALGGLSKGIGIASKLGGLGIGLAAFLTALGGAAYAIDKLGGMTGLKDVLTNLAEGLGAFSGGSLVALGALFAGSMLFGGGAKGLNIAVVGAGIAGFLTALGAAGAAVDAMGGSSGIKSLLTDLADGLGAFSDGSLIALGSLFVGSALFGMVPGGAKGAVLGIAAVGLGIGTFLTALGGAAALIDAMGGSGGIKTMLTDLAEGLGAFSDGSLVALGSLFAAGAIFGATGLAGPAALGIGAIGAGIGAFLLGLSGAAAIINLFGGGPKLKDLLVNLAEGLGAFSNIDAGNLLKITGILPLFGASMLAFFGGAGIGGIVQSLAGGMKGLIDFIFGNEKKSPMQKLSEDLQLFQNINGDNLSKIGQGMKDLASGMLGLAKLTDEDLAKVNKAAAIAKNTGSVNVAGATQPPPTSTSAPASQPVPAPTSTSAPSSAGAYRGQRSDTAPSSTPTPTAPTSAPASKTPSANKTALDITASTEGGGRYDLAFGDAPQKDGSIVNVLGKSKNFPQLAGKIIMTPKDFSGKPLTEMTLAEVLAFQEYRNREAPNTNALGKYGFMRSTLFGRDGKSGLVGQLKLPMDTIFSPDTQELLQATMREGNAAALRSEGVAVTDANLNLANSVGARGTAKLLRPENADKNALEVLGLTGAAATTNPHLNKSSKEVIAATYSKYDERGMAPGGSSGTVVASASTPSSTPASSPNPVVASAAALFSKSAAPDLKMPTLAAAAPTMGTMIEAATSAFGDVARVFDTAMASVTNVTNNNTQASAAGQQSQGALPSVYDDVFLNLFQRVT
jgi:hypothetical protein